MPWERPRFNIVQIDDKSAAVTLLWWLHLGFSTLLISNVVPGDYADVGVLLALVLPLTVIGAAALFFVARARIKGSAATARYGMRLTQMFVFLAVAAVLVSFLYVTGLAISSLIYLLVSLVALVFASRTAREFRNRN